MSLLNWLLVLLVISQSIIYRDGASIVYKSVGYAVLYPANGSAPTWTTDDRSDVNVRPYYFLVNNVGMILHNHVSGSCPSLSYEDMLVAEGANLSTMIAVTAFKGHIVYTFAVRSLDGWKKQLAKITVWKVVNRFKQQFDECTAWTKAWQMLGDEYGFIYVTVIK